MARPKQASVSEVENGFIVRTNTFHSPFDDGEGEDQERIYICPSYMDVEKRLESYFMEEKKNAKART